MLRAEDGVLKGEEWSSEKEAAWSKDFFFIQVLCRVDVIHKSTSCIACIFKICIFRRLTHNWA